MEWSKLAKSLLETVNALRHNTNDWKTVKETPEATVSSKPSSDWKGTMYKTQGILDCDPETAFRYINPTVPDSPRHSWDKSIKERGVLEHIEPNIYVTRTLTHGALAGLVSPREFIDMVVVEKNSDFLATLAQTIDYDKVTPSSDCVRGTNYPSTIMCGIIPGSPNKTLLTTLIQTDIGGMVPQSLVEQAVPNSQLSFVSQLTQALKDGGHWKAA